LQQESEWISEGKMEHRKHKYLKAATGAVAASAATVLAVGVAQPQPLPPLQAPAPAPRIERGPRVLAPRPLAPGDFLHEEERPKAAPDPEEAPGGVRNPLITWGKGPHGVRSIFDAVAKVCPQKIIVGRDITDKSKLTMNLAGPLPLFDFLDRVCRATGLSWGMIDTDTIAVLRTRPSRPSYLIQQIPQALRRTPRDPFNPFRTDPGPEFDPNFERGKRPDAVPEDAHPRTFNGQPFYVIPLQPTAKDVIDATAPKPKPLKAAPQR
jgi:hypothetical protein